MTIKTGALLGTLITLLILFPSCAEHESGVLKIGIIAPITGSLADIGAGTSEGVTMAMTDILSEDTIIAGGTSYTVELIRKDSGTDPELAVRAARELINQDEVIAIIGPPLSDLAIPVARVCEDAGIPMITQIATSPAVTEDKSHVFRVCYTDLFQGVAVARFARESLGAKTAAVLYDEANLFCRSVTGIFIDNFVSLGGEIAAHTKYTTDNKAISAQLSEIEKADPDVLFLPGYVDDLRIHLPQISESGIEATLIGCDTMQFRHEADRRLLDGAYFSAHYAIDSPSPAARAFSERYRLKFDREPTAVGALSYDAIGLLLHAIEQTGSVQASDISEFLGNMDQYHGVTGIMEFDGSPDPEKSVIIIHVENGEFVFETTIDP